MAEDLGPDDHRVELKGCVLARDASNHLNMTRNMTARAQHWAVECARNEIDD